MRRHPLFSKVFRDFASDASDGFDFERELELRAPLKAMTSRGILRPNTVRLASDDWTFASEGTKYWTAKIETTDHTDGKSAERAGLRRAAADRT